MQLLPLLALALIGLFVLAVQVKGGAAGAETPERDMERFRGDIDGVRRVDETEPACVVALYRSPLDCRVFFVGLTNQRLFVKQDGLRALRAFERNGVALAVEWKRWTDHGNVELTISQGWEAHVALPGGEPHTWRLYASMKGHPDQAGNLQAFLQAWASGNHLAPFSRLFDTSRPMLSA